MRSDLGASFSSSECCDCPGAALVHHQPVGHGTGHLRAQVLLDQAQRQVQAGGHARRRPDVAVGDEDAVGLDLDLRMPLLQGLRVRPMGGGSPPARAPASASTKPPVHSPATTRLAAGPLNEARHLGRGRHSHGIDDAGHHPGVGLAARGGGPGADGQTQRGPHLTTGHRVVVHPVEGLSHHQVGELEHRLGADGHDLKPSESR
jgi:hypothetical protein